MTFRSPVLGLACILSMFVGAECYAGDVLSLQFRASKDNTLYEDAGGALSNGSGIHLFAGRVGVLGNNRLRRGLIAFDLSGVLPSDAVISRASLILRRNKGVPGTFNVSLHKVTADWGEGTSNAFDEEGMGDPSTTNDATWIHAFYDSALWSTPGGSFEAVASDVVAIGGFGLYEWGSNAQMIADVQSWVGNPAANFGWILIGDEDAPTQSAKRFVSRTGLDLDGRPRLFLEFSSSSALFVDNFESGDLLNWTSTAASSE